MTVLKLTKDEAVSFFSALFGGEHHIPGHAVIPVGVGGYYVDSSIPMATYDGRMLTNLVFLAHERAVRVEISPCRGSRLRISIWKRVRSGEYYERHPTLEDAHKDWKLGQIRL